VPASTPNNAATRKSFLTRTPKDLQSIAAAAGQAKDLWNMVL
jgi:hypothetical protein